MRRFTGTYDGEHYVIREYDTGLLEVPETIRATLQDANGQIPRGEALEQECRVLFGESFAVRED
jgi:hypothetical protein